MLVGSWLVCIAHFGGLGMTEGPVESKSEARYKPEKKQKQNSSILIDSIVAKIREYDFVSNLRNLTGHIR